MINNILHNIVYSHTDNKLDSLKELRTLLEKTERGIELASEKDLEWSYDDQLKEVRQCLDNVNDLIKEQSISEPFSWWNNMNLEEKFYICIEHNQYIVGDNTRNPNSLTDNEIQTLYGHCMNNQSM